MTRKGPEPIADILSELFAKRGYARVRSGAALEEAWRQSAGEAFAEETRVGGLRRGVLEVVVANSTLLQELQFAKQFLLEGLKSRLPDEPVKDLRFRVGSVP